MRGDVVRKRRAGARRGVTSGLLLLALAVSLAGCRFVDLRVTMTTPVPDQTPTAAPHAYSGTITCVGSSVLAPLVVEAGERFRQAYPYAYIVVITATSQSALSAVQDGGADLGLSDVSVAAFRGIDGSHLYDYPVAASVYAVIAHPDVGVTGLTNRQVQDLYTGDVGNWNGVGGANVPVEVISRPKGAGPRALFREIVLGGETENDNVATPQETNQDVVTAVRDTPGAIGYVSLSAVEPGVRVLALDGVMPDVASARLGRYPFWGIEHIYTKGPAGGLAAAFIDYLQSSAIQTEIFKARGFIPRAEIPEQVSP
jgi:phosphate transport system substrate-binding protein